jgi:hypothetical protein
MAISYTALKTECQTNPLALTSSLTGLTLSQHFALGDDSIVADILNVARAAIQIKRADVSPSEIFHALDLVDLQSNPGAASNSWMEAVLTAPFTVRLQNDNGTDTSVMTNLVSLLKVGTTATKTRVLALATRAGSRAEQLFGANTFITASDVAIARAS